MSNPIVECRNLGCRSLRRVYFEGVSFRLNPGEGGLLLAEALRNSRTLLYACATLIEPTGGQISWFGQPAEPLTEKKALALRRRIGFIHRETRLISNMTILDNITLGLLYYRKISHREVDFEVEGLLDRLGLLEHRYSRPADVSYEKGRLAVYARELAKKPKLLLLETPSLDLGQNAYGMMMSDIRDMADKQECAFLVSAASPEESRLWVDWVMVMDKKDNPVWKIDEFDPARDFPFQPRLDESYRNIRTLT